MGIRDLRQRRSASSRLRQRDQLGRRRSTEVVWLLSRRVGAGGLSTAGRGKRPGPKGDAMEIIGVIVAGIIIGLLGKFVAPEQQR